MNGNFQIEVHFRQVRNIELQYEELTSPISVKFAEIRRKAALFEKWYGDVPKVNPAVTASTNKFTTGYTYDSSGNITEDANEWTYVFDAENKQIEVKDDQNATVGQYYYDGDGKRIKKYVPDTGETTVFVYDAAGKQIAEYSTIVQSSNDAKIVYPTADHLGSPRINTDYIGAVVARHDYHPFGEEIATAQRTTGVGYTEDTIRKKFTGYENDPESFLNFAEARYHNPGLGRFMSADPLLESADVEIPQSWNRYSYVINNPLVFIDPTGLIWVRSGSDTVWFTDEEWKTKSQEVDENGKSLYRVLDESEFEFNSVEGRIRLDPRGPTADNLSGWSRIGPNLAPDAVGLAGTAVAVSQLDGPEPFVADIIGLGILAYGGYQLMMYESFHIPTAPIFLNSSKDARKSNPDKVEAAEKALEALKGTLAKLKSTPNKTPEIKKQIDIIRKAINKAIDAMKKSEPHGIKGKKN